MGTASEMMDALSDTASAVVQEGAAVSDQYTANGKSGNAAAAPIRCQPKTAGRARRRSPNRVDSSAGLRSTSKHSRATSKSAPASGDGVAAAARDPSNTEAASNVATAKSDYVGAAASKSKAPRRARERLPTGERVVAGAGSLKKTAGVASDRPSARSNIEAAATPADIAGLVAQIQETARSRQDLLRMQGDLVRRLKSRARRAYAATVPQVPAKRKKARDKIIRSKATELVERMIKGERPDGIEAGTLLVYCWELVSLWPQLEQAIKDRTKQLRKLVEQLPVWITWGKDLRGISSLGLGTLILWTGDPSVYRRDGLRRRMGCAVFDGKAERLRRGERAGFIPGGKSALFMLASFQVSQKGRYEPLYRYHRPLEDQKVPDSESKGKHAHFRALRKVMTRLLDDFRQAWIDAA